MSHFKLLWENNPETPITSQRLSSTIDYFTQDAPILYTEQQQSTNTIKVNGDVKISIPKKRTLLFANFDRNLSSYDSNFYPVDASNILFRSEYNQSPGSIMIDEGVDNILSNPGFEDDTTDWTVSTSGPSASVVPTTNRYYPTLNALGNSKSLSTSITDISSSVTISRIINAQTGDIFSLSFYYIGNTPATFKIKTTISGNDNYWNGTTWTESEFGYTLPDTQNSWERFEIRNIAISSLTSIEIIVEYNEIGEYFLDSFLVERKPYNSTYYPGALPAPVLSYSKDAIHYYEGTIDFAFTPKFVGDKTFFVLVDTSGNEILKFHYMNFDSSFNFTLYNSADASTINFKQTYPITINTWEKVVVDWNLQLGFVNIYLGNNKSEFGFIPADFTPVDLQTLDRIYIGGNADQSNSIRSLLEYFKISSYQKSESKIFDEYNSPPEAEESEFHVFRSPSQSLIIDETLLDSGTSFSPNTEYFVWLCNNNDSDSSSIIVSTNPNAPAGREWFNSRVIGGFYTNSAGQYDITSIWDVSSKEYTVHADRFLLGSTRTQNIDDTVVESEITPVEIQDSNAVFNIDTFFTKHIYGRNRSTGNYLNINNESGTIHLHSLIFDSTGINTNNTDLEIFTSNSNTIYIHSDEINIQSEGTDVKLDDIRVKNNTIYIGSGNTLSIDATIDGANNVLIHGQNTHLTSSNDIVANSSRHVDIITTGKTKITSNDNTEISSSAQTIVNSNQDVEIDSSSGIVSVEDVKFDGNKIYRDASDEELQIQSDGRLHLLSNNGYVGIENLHFNQNKLFYVDETKSSVYFHSNESDATKDDIDLIADGKVVVDAPLFHVKSPDIWFEADITDNIRLDLIKINQNQIYTTNSIDLDIVSASNISLDAANNVEISGNNISFNSTLNEININNLVVTNDAMYMNTNWTLGSPGNKVTFQGNGIDVQSSTGTVSFLSDVDLSANTLSGEISFTSPIEINLDINVIDDAAPYNDVVENTITLGGSGQTINIDLSHTHDSRYYSRPEARENFVQTSADSIMTGLLTMDGSFIQIHPAGEKALAVSADGFVNYNQGLWIKSGVDENNNIINEKGASSIKLDNTIVGSSSGGIRLAVTNQDNGQNFNASNYLDINPDGIRIKNSGLIQPSSEIANEEGSLTYHGNFTAFRVYNAVWMDVAECWEKDDSYSFSYQQAVVQTPSGIRPAKKRAEKGSVGIISDSYGYILNSKDFDKNSFETSAALPIAIAGRVKVFYKGKLEIGDEVVSYSEGNVIKANKIETVFKRGRLLGRVDSIVDDAVCVIKVY